jgi:DNA-directed RNA polymerase sigma subunit (sigma70/sigma32)
MKYEFQKNQAKRLNPRNKNILKYYQEHHTSSLRDIGKVFHLSAERIRQILKEGDNIETI